LVFANVLGLSLGPPRLSPNTPNTTTGNSVEAEVKTMAWG